jgi:ribose transport system substrate-binding protein
LVVQNPYGMGYAAIVAEARCVLEIGNEAEIDTGYIWVDEENLDSKEVQRMLYIK